MGFFFSAILCGSGAIITFECGFCFLAHDIFSDPSPLRAGYLMPLPPGLQAAVFGNCKCSCKMDHLTTSLHSPWEGGLPSPPGKISAAAEVNVVIVDNLLFLRSLTLFLDTEVVVLSYCI